MTRNMLVSALMTAATAAWALTAAAATYYVSPDGNDGNDGLAPTSAWVTLEHSGNALRAGDTLVLMEGFYRPLLTLRASPGDDEKPENPIVIRAARPGTAVIHGDVELTGFEPVPGTKFVYRRPTAEPVTAVVEAGTDIVYESAGSVSEVDEHLASFHLDREARMLYVHATDGASPASRVLFGSIHSNGVHYQPPASPQAPARRFILDGLVFKGFGHGSLAVDLRNARHVTVRNCVLYHNCYGLYIANYARHIRIENNLFFSNNMPRAGSPEQSPVLISDDAGDIVVDGNIARNNRFNSIRLYGGGIAEGMEVTFSNNRSYGEGPIWFKPSPPGARMTGNIAEGFAGSHFSSRNTLPYYTREYMPVSSEGDLLFRDEAGRKVANFVDPLNGDYRLQSDSPHRGAGPDGSDLGALPYRGDVFFVSPVGDDAAEGTSVASAWRDFAGAVRRLRPGQTLYALEGVYAGPLVIDHRSQAGEPTVIRRHGRGRAVVDLGDKNAPGVVFDGACNVWLEGFEIRNAGEGSSAVTVRGSGPVKIAECLFHDNRGTAVRLENCGTVSLRNNTFVRNGVHVESVGARDELELVDNILQQGSQALLVLDDASAGRYYANYNSFHNRGPFLAPGGPGRESLEGLRATLREGAGSREADALFASLRETSASPGSDDFRLRADSPCLGRGRHERTIGRPDVVPTLSEEIEIRDVKVHHTGATTATVTWWTPNRPALTIAEVSGAGGQPLRVSPDTDQRVFHVVNLTDLHPATDYTVRPGGRYSAESWIDRTNRSWNAAGLPEPDSEGWSEPVFFRTLEADPEGRTLHVRVDGDDAIDGLSPATAWRTIGHACREARAGDTVVVGPGRYHEPIIPLNSGAGENRRIVFRSEKPREAVLDGNNFTVAGAVRLSGKEYVTIDGFRFEYQRSLAHTLVNGGNYYPQVILDRSRFCTVRNCYFNGNPPFPGEIWPAIMGLRLNRSEGTLIEDNFFLRQTWAIDDCTSEPYPEGAAWPVIKNNTFFATYIWTLNLTGQHSSTVLRNNLFGERVRRKTGLSNMRFWSPTARLDSDHNFFWWYLSSKEHPELRSVGSWHNRLDPPVVTGGLAAWQEATGQEKNSREGFFPTDNIYEQLDFTPRGKPYEGMGEGGVDSGCSWLGRHPDEVVLETSESEHDVPPWK